METNLKVNQLVVCVNDEYSIEDDQKPELLVTGKCYFLREICPCGVCGNCMIVGSPEVYHISRFRAATFKDEFFWRNPIINERYERVSKINYRFANHKTPHK